VAEGVEHEAAMTVLRDTGCPIAQGYLLGRPVDPAALAARAGDGFIDDLAMIA
jgi:EAL domain-containing protein (putative c-di-GMP-specific phosphodiesterase class I)